jgi:cholesterol transport system auxiliary component
MKDRLIRLCLRIGMITPAIILAGCGGQKSYEKQHYILDTQRASSAVASDSPHIIEIRRFTTNAAFGAKGLVYRVGEHEYKSDFYNEFLVSPAAMITEKTRNWLSTSGLFKRVLDPGSQVDPTHVMEGNVIALYGDFRAKSAPKAVMEIRIFLLETKSETESGIVFGKTYTSSVDLQSEGPEGIVSSFDRCLTEILTRVERDLAEELSKP